MIVDGSVSISDLSEVDQDIVEEVRPMQLEGSYGMPPFYITVDGEEDALYLFSNLT